MNAAVDELFAPTPAERLPRHGFGPRDALRLFFKHLWLIVGATVLVTGLVWAGLKVQPRTYDGAAKVWIKTEQQTMPAFLSGIAGVRDNPLNEPVNRRLETEMELIRSRDSVQRVIDRLQVRREQLRVAPLDAIREALAPGIDAARRSLGLRTAPVEGGAEIERQRLVDDVLTALTIEAQRSKGADTTSNVVEVRFSASDPDLVPQLIQVLLDEYFELAARQNRTLGESTLALLEAKAREARAELRESEQQLQAFMASQGDHGGGSVPGRGGRELSAGGGGSVVGQLKTQAVELQRRLDELRQVYTEEAENVKSLSRSIDRLQGRIRSEMRATAEADSQIAALERQRALAQERFVELRKRMDQIDLYLSVNPTESESRVLTERPTRPLLPDTRKTTALKLLAPVVGLLLGLMLAALREMADHRLQTPEEVERALGLPVLGAVPVLPAGPEPRAAFLHRPPSRGAAMTTRSGRADRLPPAEQAAPGGSLDERDDRGPDTDLPAAEITQRDLLFHGLAQRVRDRIAAQGSRGPAASGGRVLLLTSARAGEGKSALAKALALRLAIQDGGRVLLIDANAQAPAGWGGHNAGAGFFDLLRDRDAHARIVPSRSLRQLHMLPAGRAPQADLLFHEPALAELFERTRARYAWTVIDAGILPQIGGLSVFADGIVVVADATSTRRQVIQGNLAGARMPPGRLLGVVLNRRPQYVPGWLYRGWL